MKPVMNRRLGDRQGVALILVIGMLALMMVMGVTFAIFMRTERLAAGHFRADVQTRELLQAALARAMDGIDSSVGNASYPPWDILQSGGAGDINDNALSGAVSNWIPWAVLSATNAAPRWSADNELPSGGKISYLVLNCSGLVDVNYAGGTTRGSGTNVSEIQLSALSEVADATALVNGRPYETLQELGVKAGVALSGKPQNLVTYSAFPTNYTVGAKLDLVDISGDINALRSRKSDIISAFTRSGITDAAFAYSNLLYYVDPSVTPLNPDDLGTPLTKAVPMINEVQVTNYVIIVPPGKCQTVVRVDVEWFYPFVKGNANTFDVVCDISVTGIGSTAVKYIPLSVTRTNASGYIANKAGPVYGRTTFGTAVNPSVAFTSNDTVQLSIKVGAKMMQGATCVDSTPYPYDVASYFSVVGTNMTIPFSLNGGMKGFECIDPRFNWNTQAAGQQWASYTPMNPNGSILPPAKNWITTQYMNGSKTYANQYTEMYVAGEPLHNVGELSYLLQGTKTLDRWSTIKLCSDQRTSVSLNRVLDNFVVPTSTNRHGLVNINSRSPEALAAVFLGMPLEAYPGQSPPETKVNTRAQALDLANELIRQTATPISLMSDYGTKTNLMTIAPVSGLSTLAAQAVIRNTAGLLHFRQNYFIVLLYAQPTKRPKNDAVLSAVAEVWRDPVANPQGAHPRFVRSFKILSN